MFSFFKRSKSQKGKQKHDKLHLPADAGGAETVANGAKAASVAYASATGHAGDEENAAKNIPNQPQPPAPTSGERMPTSRAPAGQLLLPSEWPPSEPKGPPGWIEATVENLSRAATDAIGVDVSSSGPTRQHGSVRCDERGEPHENESFQPVERVATYDGDREVSSSPIDDSAGCARETQPNATSSNSYAPPNESAMAKGKNRRRYQQPPPHQQQQQQQQQQQHHHQQQHVKVQQQNALKLALSETCRVDSNAGQECVVSGKPHLTHVATTIASPIKVRQEIIPVQPTLANGDVTRDESTRTGDPKIVDDRVALAKTRTDGTPLPSACAGGHSTTITHTTTPAPESAGAQEELLNIKNVSPTAGAHEHHRQVSSVVVEHTHARVDPAAVPCSSEPDVNLAISEANAASSASSSSSAALVLAADHNANVQEMGQQPSRAGSEQRSQGKSKSASPPLPPPRSVRSSSTVGGLDLEAATRHATVLIVQDAAGDDTSDDRDVFYEATETLSARDGGRGVASELSEPTGTPEPIRASLVLKLTEPEQPRRTARKKQVSFKLTQNGSDDVEATSVDSSDADSDSEDTPGTGRSFSDTHTTAFSERNGNPPAYEIRAFAGESVEGRQNYIEFAYDNSEPVETSLEKDTTPAVEGCEKDEKQLKPGTEVLIEDSVTCLPDVVQPSNIEPLGKATTIASSGILPTVASFGTVEKINSEMKDLVNQESRYSAKFEEAEKRVKDANVKVYELQQKLDAVERDALLKEYNVERLQAELVAALKECDGIRARLTTQQAEMETIRLKASDREDELNLKYQNLEIEHMEQTEKLAEVRKLAYDLNSQLIDAKSEVDRLKEERQKLLDERTEEQKIMREALEESVRERAQVEAKWKQSFEQLRDVNNAREEDLMKDCEFTIRNMQKTCKEKMETVEKERKQALEQVCRLEELARKRTDEVHHLKSYEAEVEQLRGLTYDQKEALTSMTKKAEGLKAELETAYNKLEEEMVKVQQIKNRCEYQLCEKEREALNRIEIARGEIAMQWEDRLLHEMNRLKVELEQTHMEERTSAIEKIRRETLAETEALSKRFNEREKQLKEEIESLRTKLEQQKMSMSNAQTDADQKLLQSRMYVERAEREHERKLAKELSEKDEIIEHLKQQFESEKHDLEQHFTERIQQVQEEFAREISDATEQMKSAQKKELEKQWKTLVAEKEKALQLMDSRNKNRLEDAENKVRELTTSHQRQLNDLQEEHTFIVHSLESRDSKNAKEIQTLHKKCRCLTNLYEEMRIRYERRDPRPQDLQQIEELKSVIDSQERDLHKLTERLRELQLQQMQQEQQPQPQPAGRRSKPNRGRQPKQPSNQLQQQQQQGKKQQQQNNKQQQKKAIVQHPPEEPYQIVDQAPFAEEQLEEEDVEYIQSQPAAPVEVHIPPPQMVPSMAHRKQFEVIYEENEADIIREEEEAEIAEQQQHRPDDVDDGDDDSIEENPDENDEQPLQPVLAEDNIEKGTTVVDIPESAIHTEDRVIQSTTPTIIDELETEDVQHRSTFDEEQMPQKECLTELQRSVVIVPAEDVMEATARPRDRSSTPRIVITDDTEKESSDLEDENAVVEITEESSPVIVELPAVYAKTYPPPMEIPNVEMPECVGDSAHVVPEETVNSTPDGATPEGQRID
ncbi:trichohyalin [Anopheles nili]|uniref:trichohyalin n=1 Tax=Anopheles nili TaxID=185578 RepID=UPI00237BF773|nr:trichohyalin [Anopheles nili]